MSCPDCPTTVVLTRLICPSSCSGSPAPCFLSWFVFSWLSSLAILSQLSCFSNLVLSFPIPAVLSLLSCHSRPVLYVRSRLSCLAHLSRLSGLSYPRGPFPTVLSWLSCLGCPVPAGNFVREKSRRFLQNDETENFRFNSNGIRIRTFLLDTGFFSLLTLALLECFRNFFPPLDGIQCVLVHVSHCY